MNNQNENKEEKNKNKKLLLSLLVLVLLIALITVGIVYFTKIKGEEDDKTLAYTDLIKEMSYGNIEKIEMTTGSTQVKVKMKNDY